MGYFWETAVCNLARSAGWVALAERAGPGWGMRQGQCRRGSPGERPLANPRWVEGGVEGGCTQEEQVKDWILHLPWRAGWRGSKSSPGRSKKKFQILRVEFLCPSAQSVPRRHVVACRECAERETRSSACNLLRQRPRPASDVDGLGPGRLFTRG